MKKIMFILMMLLMSGYMYSQEVTKNGTEFTQVSKRGEAGKGTKTQYTYKDSKGNVYPVYLSASGKAFIKRISQKTSKEYKQYLPKVGKQINPKAYEKDKS